MLQDIGQWYGPHLRNAINLGKEATKNRNDYYSVPWLDDPSLFTKKLEEIEAELISKGDTSKKQYFSIFFYLFIYFLSIVTITDVRRIVVYCYYITIPPSRAQNVRLLVLPNRNGL